MKYGFSGLCAVLLLAGCHSQPGEQTSTNASSADRANANTAAAAAIPNACTFFSRAELESAVGWELREGEPKDASAGSSCAFETQPEMYAKRKFADPALPASTGFSGITVTTFPSRAETFAQGRAAPGAEPVQSLGEDAYFNGPNLFQVRVGGRGFSLRIYTDDVSPGDADKVRGVMLALGKTGASRL